MNSDYRANLFNGVDEFLNIKCTFDNGGSALSSKYCEGEHPPNRNVEI